MQTNFPENVFSNYKPGDFYNACEHELVLYSPDSAEILMTIFPSGKIARRSQINNDFHVTNDVLRKYPVIGPPVFGSVTGLDNISEDDKKKILLVSMLVGPYVSDNLWSGPVCGPASGPCDKITDAKGNMIGTKRLVCYKQ